LEVKSSDADDRSINDSTDSTDIPTDHFNDIPSAIEDPSLGADEKSHKWIRVRATVIMISDQLDAFGNNELQ